MYKPAPFNDLNTQFSRGARLTIAVLAVCSSGYLFKVIPNVFISGIIVGGVTSILNAYFLKNRLKMLVDFQKAQARVFLRQNYYLRFLLIIVVLFFASRVDLLSILGVGAGLMLVPFIISVDAAVTLCRHLGVHDAVDKL
ncbi:MAG: ATP synthase subunit I [Clostridiales bacterium]|nr:ATP synthase subunit I [Clostridiales bacterium]MCF8022550.1 ATP synthase subunit I [Clostridiales bacterium]